MAAVRARLCSQNPHKLEELRAALPDWELELLEADGYPEEVGATFLENARAKARFGRAQVESGVWTIGEDSGIEAAALGGRPGIQSARWADDGVARLLEELAGVEDRRARYVCELVCSTPAGELRGTGILEGTLAHRAERRGGLRLRPDLRSPRRDADGGRARQRLEAASTPIAPAPRALSRRRSPRRAPRPRRRRGFPARATS